MVASDVNLMQLIKEELPKDEIVEKPETVEDKLQIREFIENDIVRPEDLIQHLSLPRTIVIKTIPFNNWIDKIVEEFKIQVKKIDLSRINGIDTKNTILLNIPNLKYTSRRELVLYQEMENYRIFDLPVVQISFFINKTFLVYFQLDQFNVLKVCYDKKDCDITICFISNSGLLVPYQTIVKEVKTNVQEIEICLIGEKEAGYLEQKLNQPVNYTALSKLYKMVKNNKGTLNTNKEMIEYFNDIIAKTIDRKHFEVIDTAITTLMTST